MTALLEVSNLKTSFLTDEGEVTIVNDVSFSVKASRTLAIVGESGCGKSVTALSIMGLLAKPAGRIAQGSICFEGQELVGAPERMLQDLRGNGMSMIFQEPMAALDPCFTIGHQLAEVIRLVNKYSSNSMARARAAFRYAAENMHDAWACGGRAVAARRARAPTPPPRRAASPSTCSCGTRRTAAPSTPWRPLGPHVRRGRARRPRRPRRARRTRATGACAGARHTARWPAAPPPV